MATIGVEKRRLSLKRSKGSDFKQAKENKMESNGVEDTLPYCRLVNLGNTCYINVIIQCMKFTPGFIELIDRTVKVMINCYMLCTCIYRMNNQYMNQYTNL